MQRLRALQRLAGKTSNSKGIEVASTGIRGDNWSCTSLRLFAAEPAKDDGQPKEEMVEVTVNGRPVSVPKGSNVLQACEAGGVDIPR
jgi:hypothetical protein